MKKAFLLAYLSAKTALEFIFIIKNIYCARAGFPVSIKRRNAENRTRQASRSRPSDEATRLEDQIREVDKLIWDTIRHHN